jgi:peptide subunit release factor 1 (eRF1)
MLTSRRFFLGRSKALNFLDGLASNESRAITLYLPQGTPRVRAEDLLGSVFATDAIPPGIAGLMAGSATGAAFFWSRPQMYLLLPPFPIAEEYIAGSYDVGPLRSLLGRDFLMALVMVRLGAYSIGICRGTELIGSKTGTGLVHARHKKGGSSQARFARHREKQIEQFLERVCGHAREHIEPHARSLDYLVYGGARTTILLLRKRCPFLNQFDDRILRMLLDIPEPRQAVLEKAVGTIWSTDVIQWCEHDS